MAHPIAAAFPDVPSGLRLVSCIGARWPAELSNGDWMIFAPDLLLEQLSSPKQGPFWLGYVSPVNLLLQQQPSHAAGLEQLLHDWLEHTSIFLEALTSAPTRTRLINLSHQPPLAGEQAALSPDRLPLPLQLYLQKRGDVLDRYADLEAQADLLGRQPEFVLPFASPTSNDWKGLLLQSWEAHQAIKQLTRERDAAAAGIKEAREEGELTMVQLQQVQEELEQYFLRCRSSDQLAEEQATRIEALEASALQLTRERDAAAAGIKEAREEGELTMVQLQQVQEELEQYFLRCRSSDQLAEEQATRIEALEASALQLTRERDAAAAGIKEAREEGELTMVQLQQVQEELEQYFLRCRSSDQLAEEQATRIEALEASALQLTRERDAAAAGIKEAREEGELTMVQLQQVQEELEQYFLRCRSSDQLVEAQSEQNHRAFSLIGRMLRLFTVPT